MSFVVAYRPFINVSVEEEGTGQELAAFKFAPTHDCGRVLADRRMVFRQRETGFQIFYQTNPMVADPLLGAVTSRIRLSFAAYLIQPDLFEVYEPDLTAETGPQLYFDNLTPAGNIQAKNTLTTSTVVQSSDASRVYPPVFQATVDLSGGTPPTTFRVLDKFTPSTVVLTVPISGASGLAQTKIDLSGEPSGPYTLKTNLSSPPARTIYVDGALAQSGVLGVLDLYWETRQDTVPAGGLDYFIRLRPR